MSEVSSAWRERAGCEPSCQRETLLSGSLSFGGGAGAAMGTDVGAVVVAVLVTCAGVEADFARALATIWMTTERPAMMKTAAKAPRNGATNVFSKPGLFGAGAGTGDPQMVTSDDRSGVSPF